MLKLLFPILLLLLFLVAIILYLWRRLSHREEELSQLRVREAQLIERNETLRQRTQELLQSEADRSAQEEAMAQRFQVMAQEVLDARSNSMTQSHKESLQTLLAPLQEKIESFRKQVQDAYEYESRDRSHLIDAVNRLKAESERLSKDANNLADALKGNSKKQGDWGEMILYTLLENSGLQKGQEYETQVTLRDASGIVIENEMTLQRMRPDAIVKFPDKRYLIIDAKVSLKAYSDWFNAPDEEERKRAADRLLLSVRNHIDDLSKRQYSTYLEGSPDFVILFVSVEPALTLAMQLSPTLWKDAYDKKVLLLSSTNLIGMLRMVNDLWTRHHQDTNVKEIIAEVSRLYDKICGYTQTFCELKKSIAQLSNAYDKAENQLFAGRGNILRRCENIKKKGIKTTSTMKSPLPPSAMNDDTDEEEPA